MQLNITARHLDLTPALSDYVHRKVEKAQRYSGSIIWAQAILAVEKHRHIAELVVHTPGSTFRTKEEAGDLYSAIDLVAHKLDVHLSRQKDKKVRTRNDRSAKNLDLTGARALKSDGTPVSRGASSPEAAPKVADLGKFDAQPLTLAEAIEELDGGTRPFYLFKNTDTQELTVIFKKGKKGYALLAVEDRNS